MFQSDTDFDFDGDFFGDTFGNTSSKNSQKEEDNRKVNITSSDSNVKIKAVLPKTATIESYQPKVFVSDKLKTFVFKRRAEGDKTKSGAVTKTVEGLESLPKRIHEDGNNKLIKTKEISKLECESNVVKCEASCSKLGRPEVTFELKKRLETYQDDNNLRFESKKRQIPETTHIFPKKICSDSNFDFTNQPEIDSSKKLVQNRSISEISQINLSAKESEKACVNVERPFEFMDDDDLDLDTIVNNPNFKEPANNLKTAEESRSLETKELQFGSNQSKSIEKQNFASKNQSKFQSLETKSNALIPKQKRHFSFKKPSELQNSPKPICTKEKIVLKTNESDALKSKLTESPTTTKTTLSAAQNEARLKRLSVIKKLSKSPRLVRKFPGPAGLLPERKDLGVHTFFSNGVGDQSDKLETTQVIPCSQSTLNIFEEGPWMRMTDDFQVHDDIAIFLPGKYTVEWIKRTARDEKLINRKAPFLAAIVHKLEIVDMRLPVVSVFLKDMTGGIQGTIPRDLYKQHIDKLTQGSVLVLKQFGVLTVSRALKHYVNVTENNLVAIYSRPPGQPEIVPLYIQKLTPGDIIRNIQAVKELHRLMPRAIQSFGRNDSARHRSMPGCNNNIVKPNSSVTDDLQRPSNSGFDISSSTNGRLNSITVGDEKEVVENLFQGFDTSCLFDDF